MQGEKHKQFMMSSVKAVQDKQTQIPDMRIRQTIFEAFFEALTISI